MAPLGRLLGRDVVTELGVQLRRHVDEILALVPVFGRFDALVARVERIAELVELGAGVVEVVLAVHLGALRREQVRDRVADRDPAPTARVQGPGGIGRDELEVYPPAREHRRAAVPIARRDHITQDVVQPRRREEEVEEAGPGNLDLGEMRNGVGLERSLEHPSLAPVKLWFDRHLPVARREGEIA